MISRVWLESENPGSSRCKNCANLRSKHSKNFSSDILPTICPTKDYGNIWEAIGILSGIGCIIAIIAYFWSNNDNVSCTNMVGQFAQTLNPIINSECSSIELIHNIAVVFSWILGIGTLFSIVMLQRSVNQNK
jgi:hypothetical protein